MTSRSARTALVALATAVAVLTALAGCGSGGDAAGTPSVAATLSPSVSDGTQVFAVVGQVDQTFSARELVARPGRIRVDFSVVKGSAPHNFVITAIPGASTKIVSAGDSQSITFTASEPGRYPVICTLHPAMTATLVIV